VKILIVGEFRTSQYSRILTCTKGTVLVIENGYISNDISTQAPTSANNVNIKFMYNISSAPDANTGGSHPVWVGNVVGGGSVINGMALDRASAADYDAWQALGNPGWDWASLFDYFRKSTTFIAPTTASQEALGITFNASAYGSGPIAASFPPFDYADMKDIWASWRAAGVPLPTEHASGNAVGAYWTPNSLQPDNQTRSDARNAYYDPVQGRHNLVLAQGRTVNEILFKPGIMTGFKATGVQYKIRSTASIHRVYAKREVILAAGSIFTPQLLQLSGIGPREILRAANIRVKRCMPAVGANLQDHPNAQMLYNLTNLSFPNPFSTQDPVYNASAWDEYRENRTGPITQAHGNSLAFLSLQSITNNSNAIVRTIRSQYVRDFLPSVYEDAALLRGFIKQREIISDLHSRNDAAVAEFPMVSSGLAMNALQRPLSRGTVTLDPENKYGHPVIQWNTFQNPVDKQILAEMVRWTRQHWSRPELSKFSPREVCPGPEAQSDDEIMDGLNRQGALEASEAHMSGSCSMMPQKLGGCVGSDLRVYGTTHLSIVDASVLPLIPATHLQATMYAVAEKAADLIKSRNMDGLSWFVRRNRSTWTS
jgi:choline dehydrogenase-like flavoprotein